MATKVKRSTFAITLKESEKTPKYRNYMKRENLNLVCPAKCHPLQLETPERARCTPLGVDLKVNPRKLRNKENTKMENLNLVCPAKCHPLKLETPERARFTPLGLGYKSETSTFAIFKGIRENSEIPKLMKRENLNLVCPAKCHPLQLETPERARLRPSVWT
ncbi:hypothetical protein Fcan01_28126 [Folsomia candida]|uniref:Uncharacterized protein n=1 Tax=Folsomia candida TaxID=158441 RepID=A0A226CVW6_FOLCA|nr:hypothetical protein Fcan01_28126 [Folsomia candida]